MGAAPATASNERGDKKARRLVRGGRFELLAAHRCRPIRIEGDARYVDFGTACHNIRRQRSSVRYPLILCHSPFAIGATLQPLQGAGCSRPLKNSDSKAPRNQTSNFVIAAHPNTHLFKIKRRLHAHRAVHSLQRADRPRTIAINPNKLRSVALIIDLLFRRKQKRLIHKCDSVKCSFSQPSIFKIGPVYAAGHFNIGIIKQAFIFDRERDLSDDPFNVSCGWISGSVGQGRPQN